VSGSGRRLHELSTAELLVVLEAADGDALQAAHAAAPQTALVWSLRWCAAGLEVAA